MKTINYKKNHSNYILKFILIKQKVFILLCAITMILFTTFACKENSTSISSSVPYFPVQKAGMATMEVILEGKLELDNGCLRIKYFDDNYLLIWPYGFSLRTEGEEIQVIDENGQVFARVGDNIRVGGGEITGENAKELIEKYYIETPLPEDCQGPYWVVGEVVYNGSDLGAESSDASSSNEIDGEDELFSQRFTQNNMGLLLMKLWRGLDCRI